MLQDHNQYQLKEEKTLNVKKIDTVENWGLMIIFNIYLFISIWINNNNDFYLVLLFKFILMTILHIFKNMEIRQIGLKVSIFCPDSDWQ